MTNTSSNYRIVFLYIISLLMILLLPIQSTTRVGGCYYLKLTNKNIVYLLKFELSFFFKVDK